MRAVAQERQEVWSVKLSVEADLPPVVLLAFVVISFEQFMEILKEGKNDYFFSHPNQNYIYYHLLLNYISQLTTCSSSGLSLSSSTTLSIWECREERRWGIRNLSTERKADIKRCTLTDILSSLSRSISTAF